MKVAKAVVSFAFSAVKSLGGMCWSAITNMGPMLTKAWSWVKDIAGVVTTVWDKVQGWIKPLWDFYTKYVKPVLDFVHGALETVQGAIALIQGKLDKLWEMVTETLLEPVKKIIDDVNEIKQTIEDIIRVFDTKLADRIQAYDIDITKKINAWLDEIYDKTIGEVKGYLDIALSKVNTLEALIFERITPLQEAFEKLGHILEITFEQPGVLKRESLRSTSMRWGVDLWNDLFSGVTPTTPVNPSLAIIQLQADVVIDKHIETIFATEAGDWADVSARVDEEIRELFYGEVVPVKTQIEVPELPKPSEIIRGLVPLPRTAIKWSPFIP